MSHNRTSIPVQPMGAIYEADTGIAVKQRMLGDLASSGTSIRSHRLDCHFFIVVEKGSVALEIDFEQYQVTGNTVIYLHPSQVHRVLRAENTGFSLLAISQEKLNPAYLRGLNALMPIRPLPLNAENAAVIHQAMALCINFFQRKDDVLYRSSLQDSCNALVALLLSQWLTQPGQADRRPRFEQITRAFQATLEHDFARAKRPSDYARALHISAPYLNECVSNTTGLSVSQHIRQRIILEAKRLLHHSDKSVKEIAAELGYEDYAYFSRVFSRATGKTASAFRSENPG